MKKLRILSAILSFIMVFGMLANLSLLPVFASDTDTEAENGTIPAKDRDNDFYRENYLEKSYRNKEDKIKTMTKYLESDKYIFYIDVYSGEFALQNKITGQLMFSNPYDVGTSVKNESAKKTLLSQVIINYSDSGVDKTYTSFENCVMLNQLSVKNLKNGVRVEYAIGNTETRKLLPMQISKERFETEILANIPEGRAKDVFLSFYQLKSLDDPTLTSSGKQQLLQTYPIVEQFPIYVFSTDAKENEKIRQETVIKTYCPLYSFEELQADHDEVGYTAANKAPAVFKFALEYSLDDSGLNVRLGANGIRFDETVYTLKDIKLLPYVGAGSSANTGYVFIPDGSGTLIRFEDVAKQSVTISGKLYGADYAFHTVTGTTQEVMRLPVYGVVETTLRTVNVPGHEDETTGEWVEDQLVQYPLSSGYLAIIEEGDSLATLFAETGGTLHNYNTAYTSFNPRPSDQYNLSDSISVGSNATWTVVSDRKYTGSYRIKYVMLDDELLAEDIQKEDESYSYYKASYVGMADAYRDYLLANGHLTLLKDEDVKDNIPLYIESFGTIDTVEKFLSFPVTVETPLTTFDNLMTMYSELESAGIDNINFRLTGFTNGGMLPTVPAKVDFQKEVGGNKGYTEFLEYAGEKGIGVYPDFDFVYLSDTGMFDGYSSRRDAVRTIDDRYTQSQKYDNVYQTLMPSGNVVISVSAFSDFYEGFHKDYKKFGATSVSVSTLGSALNSDFDEDNPYNREDARSETIKILEKLSNDYSSVMSDAGNAYILKYVDHLLDVSLEGSRYISSSQSIPFVGMVIHGSVQFAGAPLNTTGNIATEILRMIESGASPYFLLSYQNTADLKDYAYFSEYFSVRYDIWKDDLVEYYNILNEALSDVQSSTITDHEFVQGERVPSEEEILADQEEIKKAEEEVALNKVHKTEKERRAEILAAKLEALKKEEEEPDEGEEGETENPDVGETPDTETPDEETPDTEAPDTETPDGETPDTEEPGTDKPEETPAEPEEDVVDIKTKYLTEKGTVVKVTYSNGKTFILNYNNFEIKVGEQKVPALGFVVVKSAN